jgi:excisionase family DNA binding protein
MGQAISQRSATYSDIDADLRFFVGGANPMSARLMTLKDFARHIGVSYSTARRMVAEEKVRVVRPRRRPMIPASEIAKFTFPVVIVVDEV